MRIRTLKYRNTLYRTRKTPLFLFCYHKTGTVLFSKIFTAISAKINLNFAQVYGYCDKLLDDMDIVLFSHACVSDEILSSDYRGIHIIRDPREVIVSGYLYHLRTQEPWCTVPLTNQLEELSFPVIPTFKSEATFEEKIEYLTQFNGESYQELLKNKSTDDGILFEMNNYAGWTIDCMKSWNYHNSKVLEIKFEHIMDNFDEIFKSIFSWLNFSQEEIIQCLEIAIKEDISRMNNSKKESNNHISKEGQSKWKKYLSSQNKQIFKERYPSLLKKLNYEQNDTW